MTPWLAKSRPSLRVGLLVTPQFTLNALANFVDVLRLAGDEGDASGGILSQYDLMSVDQAPVRASCGYQLIPTAPLLPPSDLDYVAVIGGLLYRGRSIDSATKAYLRLAAASSVPLLGICTGTFLLCRSGLMQNRKCCLSWFHHADFTAEFPEITPVADQLYVEDRNRITCSGGVGAALTAALLVGRHLGRGVAQKCLRIMQIGPSENLQPAPPSTAHFENKLVTRAVLLMEQHISEPLPIETIASTLRISRRTLERQFERHTGAVPRTIYMNLRLSHARILLEAKKPLSQVANETGFASIGRLSAAFRLSGGGPLTGR